MRQPQDTDVIERVISVLLDEICKQHITDASMLPLILSKDEKLEENLRMVDCLYQSVLTSLQFGQYRRATWYLQAFSLACKRTFGVCNRERAIQALQKHINIYEPFLGAVSK